MFAEIDIDLKLAHDKIIAEKNTLNLRVKQLENFDQLILDLKMKDKTIQDDKGNYETIFLQPKDGANNNMKEDHRISQKSDLIVNIEKSKVDNIAAEYYKS